MLNEINQAQKPNIFARIRMREREREERKRAGGMAQAVACLPNKCKALVSNPSAGVLLPFPAWETGNVSSLSLSPPTPLFSL
jgi:hypothetical protein